MTYACDICFRVGFSYGFGGFWSCTHLSSVSLVPGLWAFWGFGLVLGFVVLGFWVWVFDGFGIEPPFHVQSKIRMKLD